MVILRSSSLNVVGPNRETDAEIRVASPFRAAVHQDGNLVADRRTVEWFIDRYQVKTDKDLGIVNDSNDWSREVGNPRRILDLLVRIVRLSVETMKVVDLLRTLMARRTA